MGIMKSRILKLSFLLCILCSTSAQANSVAQCSYIISRSIDAGECVSWASCWSNIAKKLKVSTVNSSVAASACAVANKIAYSELSKESNISVASCLSSIAKHLGENGGSVAESTCNIAKKVLVTGVLE